MAQPLRLAIVLAASCTYSFAQWDPASPTANPGALGDAAMSNCTLTGNVLLCGGRNGSGAANNQMWSYDGVAWFQTAPWATGPARWGHDMVYDPAGIFVTFGGENPSPTGGPALADMWSFDGNWWSQVTPATSPPGVAYYGLCFDSTRTRIVMYGGRPDNRFAVSSSDTWEWDRVTWSLRPTTVNPGPLERTALCYHQQLGKAVLFGGVDAQTGSGNDKTWTWDGTVWTELTIVGPKPAPRSGARLEYDSARGVSVLHGGRDPATGTHLLDTWEFDGAVWTQQVTAAPAGRAGGTLAYLAPRRKMVLFGGHDHSTSTWLSETWEYGAHCEPFGAGCAGTHGTPELSAQDAPRLGQDFTLGVQNLEPTFNIAVMVFGATPLAGLDLGPLLGMPGCFAYQTPDLLLLATPGAGGTAAFSWLSVSGTVGDSFRVQALCFDPLANTFGWTMSNALDAKIGF